jgi:hypothetical protein
MNFKLDQSPTVILIRSPILWLISFVAINCAILLLLWLAFDYGQNLAGFSSAESRAYISELEEKLKESQEKNIESSRQATMLERNSQIDGSASGELKVALVNTQNEVLALKKELSFYKSIVSPEQGERSLAIQTIGLEQDDDGNYHYKLMVSQRGRNDRLVRGTVTLRIEGTNDLGEAQTLALSTVSNDTKIPMKFGFKYFQNFTGVMKLPDGFFADILHVKVKPSKGKVKAINEQFVWSDLTARGI